MFEVIDHTADIGLRIQAATLEGLFQEAAEGMFSLLVEDLTTVREETAVSVEIAAGEIAAGGIAESEIAAGEITAGRGFALPERVGLGEGGEVSGVPKRLPDVWEDLLHDWLAELLVMFDARRMVFRRFDVRFTATGLQGRAWGEELDSARHRPRMEIKAVTYYKLHICQTERGYESQVIFDL